MKTRMRVGSGVRKLLLALLAGAGVWAVSPSVASASLGDANTEIDYFGKNLFLGIAYHRYGCAFNGGYSNSTTNDRTYQGFTGTQYCYNGNTWANTNSSASTYYGYSTAGNLSDSWLGYYFSYANYDYGEALIGSNLSDWHSYGLSWQTNYANNSTGNRTSRDPSGAINYCSYNVLSNCNSDCWIGDFSTKQGAIVPTLSPCF